MENGIEGKIATETLPLGLMLPKDAFARPSNSNYGD